MSRNDVPEEVVPVNEVPTNKDVSVTFSQTDRADDRCVSNISMYIIVIVSSL